MATYVVDGKEYVLPDDVSPDDAMKLITGEDVMSEGGTSQTPESLPQANSETSIDPDTLQHSSDWLNASAILWRMNNNTEFDGGPKELAEYGLDQMGWFNYNLPRMAVDTARVTAASNEQKKAFLYLMNTYDDLELSWGGVLRFGKGVLMDPTTYVGLSTLGIGTAASTATKVASKEGVKSLLKAGAMGAVEGAVANVAANSMEQQVRVAAGEREKFDWSEAAVSAGLGAGAGFALGGAIDVGGTVLRKAPNKAIDGVSTPPASPGAPEAPKAPGAPASPAPEAPKVEPTVNPQVNAEGQFELPLGDTPTPKVEPEAPHVKLESNPVIEAVKEFATNDGLRVFPRSREAMSEASAKAVDVLRKLTPDSAARIIEDVRRADITGEETSLVKHAFLKANQKLHLEVLDLKAQIDAATDPAQVAQLRSQVGELLEFQKAIRSTDHAESSLSGLDLGARRDHIDTGDFREVSVDTFLQKMGVNDRIAATPEQINKATDQYLDALFQQHARLEQREAVAKVSSELQDAVDAGDWAKADRLRKERDLEVEKQANLNESDKTVYQKTQSVIKYLNEYLISTVFTTKTVLINVVPSAAKMAYRPVLDYVVKGADAKAFREMTATYAAFGSNMGTAFRYAKFAFKVERGLLNGISSDMNKVLEEEVMFKGAFGRYLRTFPRILGATDEFFGQLNYRAFVQAQAAGDAYEGGIAQGLKGKALDDFIKTNVEDKLNKAFTQNINAPQAIDFLRRTGAHNYGYKGAKLDHFVMTELQKNQDLFNKATNQSGLDYSNDLAFKREFSGKGMSSLPKAYEGFVNRNPWMRLMGQMFFRTPVRVFEEGFRLTAGLNLITPNFIRDLRGNGPGGPGGYAQIRAQGEAVLSFGIATAVMAAYARGAITGGGPQDWRQRRDVDDGDWNAYAIRFGDGSEFNFRNLDPFSTPLKIITNALDRYALVNMRKAQGEFELDETMMPEILAYVSAGSMAVVQAIKDANLTDGIDQFVDFVSNVTNPDEHWEQVMRFIGQKAKMVVPNQINKTQTWLNNPAMNDPASVEQFIRAQVNPSDKLVPRRYDAFGNEVKGGDPLAAITGFDLTSKQQRDANTTPLRQRVNNGLAALTVTTGTTFIAPYKAKTFAAASYGTGDGMDFDLRTQYVAGGGETYYDRLQRYVSQTSVMRDVDNILRKAKAAQAPAEVTASAVNDVIKTYREVAWHKLWNEERELRTKFMKAAEHNQAVKSGKRDVLFTPFSVN